MLNKSIEIETIEKGAPSDQLIFMAKKKKKPVPKPAAKQQPAGKKKGAR